MTKRLARTVAVVAAVGLVVALLHLLGVGVAGWFESLFDELTAVDLQYVVLGLVLQTLETFLSGIAWLVILRYAYPRAEIRALPILTAYAVAVAGNDVLPASLGTLVMLVMLTAIIPESTFPGLIGGQVVHKLFFVVAGAFVYLYLFLSVPGSFAVELELLDDHRVLAVLVPAAAVLVAVLVVRAFWSRLCGLWQRAKQGGAILAEPRAFATKVVLPEFGAWLCKLGVIAVFLAAYGIPVTLHTVMTVAGGNSLANVVSVTPGGAGVNQAVNSASRSPARTSTARPHSRTRRVSSSSRRHGASRSPSSWSRSCSAGPAASRSSPRRTPKRRRALRSGSVARSSTGRSRAARRWRQR